jgi:hypothetical protein
MFYFQIQIPPSARRKKRTPNLIGLSFIQKRPPAQAKLHQFFISSLNNLLAIRRCPDGFPIRLRDFNVRRPPSRLRGLLPQIPIAHSYLND